MKIKNLTPHSLNLLGENDTLVLEPEGACPRVTMAFEGESIDLNGVEIPVGKSSPGEITDLPGEVDGVLLAVSRVVATAAPERADLVFPDDLVRDDKGRVIGARRLSRI